MQAKILSYVIGMILSQLSPDLFRNLLDSILDMIEAKVEETPSKSDDRLVLPLCRMVREAFGVAEEE